jgi:hypothetical protein
VPSFKDTEGREWQLSIDLFVVGDVHKETGVSIYTLMDDQAQGLRELCSPVNRHVLANVVYLICKEQADKRGVSPRDFARALKGDPIDAMEEAFVEALADFFPDARRRAAIRQMLEAGRKIRDSLLARLPEETARLAAIDTDQVVASVISTTSSTASTGNSSASSASTPAG